MLVGKQLLDIFDDFGNFWQSLVSEDQIRWVHIFYCVEVLFKLFFIKDWIITVIINGCFFLNPTSDIFRQVLLGFFQLGPEKGVIHLATAAIVNALWDLWAKMENKVELHVHLFI